MDEKQDKKDKKAFRIVLCSIIGIVLALEGIGFIIDKNDYEYDAINDLELENEKAWNELGESMKYLELGQSDFHYSEMLEKFFYTDNFKEVFHKMHGGYYKDTNDDEIQSILKIALADHKKFEWAGDIYDMLTPPDNMNLDEYLVEINTKIAESKTVCAQIGYKIGNSYTFNDGAEYTYIGNNKFTDTDGNTWLASKTGDNKISIEQETPQVADNTQNNNSSSSNKNNSSSSSNNKNSKYVSEQWGYKKGDAANTTNNGVYTYLGNDIWQSADGTTYKARLVGSNIEFFGKSPFGVSSATDEDGYLLSNDDVVVSGGQNEPTFPDEDSSDPSGYRQGTAQWHAYWDGTTIKAYLERGGSGYFITTYNGTFYNYPDDYVIGSYAVIKEKFFDDGSDWVGKY